MSKRRCKNDFVLVRFLDAASFSIIRFLSIEGRLRELKVRYVNNSYELALMKRERKLRSEGLYVELETIDAPEYIRLERMARRQQGRIFLRRTRF